MVQELKNLLKNAYTPISKFNVASIVVTKDGKYYKGVNVEDASLRAGVCAERNALFSGITDGLKKGMVESVHVMVDSGSISTPCFVCRQMLVELCDDDTLIRCYSTNGTYNDYLVKDLCPEVFNEEDLKKGRNN